MQRPVCTRSSACGDVTALHACLLCHCARKLDAMHACSRVELPNLVCAHPRRAVPPSRPVALSSGAASLTAARLRRPPRRRSLPSCAAAGSWRPRASRPPPPCWQICRRRAFPTVSGSRAATCIAAAAAAAQCCQHCVATLKTHELSECCAALPAVAARVVRRRGGHQGDGVAADCSARAGRHVLRAGPCKRSAPVQGGRRRGGAPPRSMSTRIAHRTPASHITPASHSTASRISIARIRTTPPHHMTAG